MLIMFKAMDCGTSFVTRLTYYKSLPLFWQFIQLNMWKCGIPDTQINMGKKLEIGT